MSASRDAVVATAIMAPSRKARPSVQRRAPPSHAVPAKQTQSPPISRTFLLSCCGRCARASESDTGSPQRGNPFTARS